MTPRALRGSVQIPVNSAFGESQLSEIQLDEMWKAFEAIFFGAQSCCCFREDENAWTVAVVQKILNWGAAPANEGEMIAWKNV